MRRPRRLSVAAPGDEGDAGRCDRTGRGRGRRTALFVPGDRTSPRDHAHAQVVGAGSVRGGRPLGECQRRASSAGCSWASSTSSSRRTRGSYPLLPHPRLQAVSLRAGPAAQDARERLGLQPGDLVEVRSKEEIFATLDERDPTADCGSTRRCSTTAGCARGSSAASSTSSTRRRGG